MPLGRAVDAVGPVKPSVEPLRRIGCGHLCGQHVARLVVERPGIALRREVAALPAPVGPAACEATEDLAGIRLLCRARIASDGDAALDPVRNAVLGNALGLV